MKLCEATGTKFQRKGIGATKASEQPGSVDRLKLFFYLGSSNDHGMGILITIYIIGHDD